MIFADGGGVSRTSLVLFGTETGTSQDLALEVSRILERNRFAVDVDELDNASPTALAGFSIVVFVLSTTGQGDFPDNSRRFWRSLLRKKLSSTFLSGVTYALVGLGDSSYPKFNFAARKLDKRVRQLGAISFIEPCEADEQGEDSTDGAFISWSRQFKSKLIEVFPLPEGQDPIPDGETLVSKWTLMLSAANGSVHDVDNAPALPSQRPPAKVSDVPFPVVLERNDRVTPSDHWQDVRFMSLKANQSIPYCPGDALSIRPRNMPEDVQELIRLMRWEGVADEPVCFYLNKPNTQIHRLADPSLSTDKTYTLRHLLTSNLDIRAIPRRSFFGMLSEYSDNDMHKERLLEFTDPQYLDEYYDYATRPRRSIFEILQEFDSVRIPWQEAINVFPVLRPRQFSIASGGALKQGGSTFELLVAIVKYRTVIKHVREGVCTRYLAKLLAGDRLDVTLKTEGRFHQPEQLSLRSHLLVGAGTGIAPLRALIHEKKGLGTTSTLIFGCRNARADYFFQDEWGSMAKDNTLEDFNVLTAFSRDQKQKVYIQDKIREHPLMVKSHLLDPNSTTIVCGSSGAMPKAVRSALVDVLRASTLDDSQNGALSQEEAEQYLAKMEKEGRYKQETW